MKKWAILSITCNILAIVSYVLSIVLRKGDNNPALGTIFLCGGSVFLIFGIFLSRKSRK